MILIQELFAKKINGIYAAFRRFSIILEFYRDNLYRGGEQEGGIDLNNKKIGW